MKKAIGIFLIIWPVIGIFSFIFAVIGVQDTLKVLAALIIAAAAAASICIGARLIEYFK